MLIAQQPYGINKYCIAKYLPALKAFIESECNYKGDFLNGYPDIASADMCQEICARSAHCDYFLYNQVNKNCDMLDSRVRECRILMGPPQPSWQVCQPEGNISTSTPFPPTQTTSKPSTANTLSSASSISTQPASFTTTRYILGSSKFCYIATILL